MPVLRCTAKIARAFKLGLEPDPPPSVNALGDWYVNAVPTSSGELILFVSANTRLAVICPVVEIGDLLLVFKDRLSSLLEALSFSEDQIAMEIDEMATFSFAEMTDPSGLAVMSDIALTIQAAVEDGKVQNADGLFRLEIMLAEMPAGPLGSLVPVDVARDLLGADPLVH